MEQDGHIAGIAISLPGQGVPREYDNLSEWAFSYSVSHTTFPISLVS